MVIRIRKKKPKRKAGARAGLNRSAIAMAAARLLESEGADRFSIRKLGV